MPSRVGFFTGFSPGHKGGVLKVNCPYQLMRDVGAILYGCPTRYGSEVSPGARQSTPLRLLPQISVGFFYEIIYLKNYI